MGKLAKSRNALTVALVLSLLYMAAEVIGGFLAGSLALLADAGHMLSDAASLALALLASRLARKPPDSRLTYGYFRAEILAATVNAAALLAVAIIVLLEAIKRLRLPQPVNGKVMLFVGLPGLAVNVVMLLILHREHKTNLNLRAAFLHVLADAMGSVQVVGASLLINAFHWTWVDPVASIVLGLLIFVSGLRVLKEATLVLMEGTPEGLDVHLIGKRLVSIKGVVGFHDLHVWTIASHLIAASLHLEVTEEASENVLWEARQLLEKEFGIVHSTIQVEKQRSTERRTLPTHPQR